VTEYKGLPGDRYRGQRLGAVGKTMAEQAFMDLGFRGMISYVEFDNADSLKSSRRMGARLFGSIFIFGMFRHYVVFATRGCRKFGVRIERERERAASGVLGQETVLGIQSGTK